MGLQGLVLYERRAGVLVFHLLCCSSRAFAANRLQRAWIFLLLEELLSRMADTFILACECSRATALHLVHLELPAKRQPPCIELHNLNHMPSTFNWPVFLPEVIRGQIGNGNKVLQRESDSHCHNLLDLWQRKQGEMWL